MSGPPYNPLDKINLARSIQSALLARDPVPMAETGDLKGAGIYVIYYKGGFPPYRPIAAANSGGKFLTPIYIGKAIPKGGRKGGLGADASRGRAMADRLGHHSRSVSEAENLELNDFWVRCLIVDDIWIPLGENMLIEQFKPLWNRAIDGFGNKDPGTRRATQYKSPWDILHPGREFAKKLADGPLTSAMMSRRVADFLEGREPQKLPPAIEKQIEDDDSEDA
jgi:hypothetical protein